MDSRVPKRIKLIVNKGQDLELHYSNKSSKSQTKKWRVLFLGVIEKMATAKIESESGNPEWLCEITVTCRNAFEPISLLVTDSKGHHAGQVVIPLISIPPKPISNGLPNDRPPLLLSNLYKSELEPTKKNSNPKGYLYYWMWAEDYWQSGEPQKLKIKKSLSRSMHNLSNSTMNLFRRKKSNTSYQGSQKNDLEYNDKNPFENYNDTNTKASPIRVNQLKNLNHKSESDSSCSTYNSPVAAGTGPNSPMMNGYHSKNPFDGLATTVDISIENNITKPERYETSNSPRNSIIFTSVLSDNQISLSHETSVCSKESPASNNKRYGLFSRFRANKSKSSVDLNKLGTEVEKKPKHLPMSLGKRQGVRLFEKKNELSKSNADINSWFCGDTQIQGNQMNLQRNQPSIRSRPQSFLIHTDNNENTPNNYAPYSNHTTEGNSEDYRNNNNNNNNNNNLYSTNINRHFSFNTPATTANDTFTPYNELNKAELIDKIVSFENQLKETRDRNRGLEIETKKLRNEKKSVQDELALVRDELSKLKFKLLEAGDTKYLEKSREDEISEMALWRANSKF